MLVAVVGKMGRDVTDTSNVRANKAEESKIDVGILSQGDRK